MYTVGRCLGFKKMRDEEGRDVSPATTLRTVIHCTEY